MNPLSFLLEVGCEEIPARYLQDLSWRLKDSLGSFLMENRIGFESLEALNSPRRLIVVGKGIAERQEDIREEKIGPPKKVAFDPQGGPTAAALSFAERSGCRPADLKVVTTPKGEYVAAQTVQKGDLTRRVLEASLGSLILTLPLPRSMYWRDQTGARFIRPIRWICALLNGKVLRFKVDALATGNVTFGHRILAPRKIPVSGVDSYLKAARRGGVILDPEARRRRIVEALAEHGKALRAAVVEDQDLLDTHVSLSEFPTPVVGKFNPSFLRLPKEILITVMRDHQKYFALEDGKGNLAAHFIAVMDNDSDRKGLIRRSHERVLRARFSDAEFFWETDVKVKLEDRSGQLSKIVFQEKLGTYAEKTQRIGDLANWLNDHFKLGVPAGSLERVCRLCKCDLSTQMVREFPELQGIVGGLYARAQGEAPEVTDAIYDHYRPLTLEDEVPRSALGALVSLADKLDTIVGAFSAGYRPTGSKDPLGLRRLAHGILKVILEKSFSMDLEEMLSKWSVEIYDRKGGVELLKDAVDLPAFFREHTEFVLTQKMGIPREEVRAALATNDRDVCNVRRKAQALHAVRQRESFDSLAASFKRIKNIIRKSGVDFEAATAEVEVESLVQDEERALYEALDHLKREAAPFKKSGKYEAILERIAGMRGQIDSFFEKVMVNAEDESLRRNRFNLLLNLYREFIQIADFAELQAVSNTPS
ncbi:MAG: glycine--tRNA ligase subunit beta [Acidobacteriia bacterium]|nr:glycine--tRNA ligase subunit beta [Terriglobia bacterium]